MKLGLGKASPGAGDSKQNVLVVVLLVVVIAGAGFFVFRNIMGSSAPPPPPEGPMVPGPGAEAPIPGTPPGGAPPVGPESGAPPSSGSTPQAAPPPAPAPVSQAAKPAPAPAPTAAKPEPSMEMRQMKVFGTVSISYPASWKISVGGRNDSAVFTNGSAVFEVHSPDPKATSARAIAQSALRTLAGGAAVTAQGADKVSGHDAYWIAAKQGSRTVRVVGVDGPTRVALLEYVKNGQFAAYRDVFNKMQAGITFQSN